MEAKPFLFGDFLDVDADDKPIYTEIPGYQELQKNLNAKLEEYNEFNAKMDLVLFQQASSLTSDPM